MMKTNVVPITPDIAEAHTAIATMDQLAMDIATGMLRRQNVLGTEREAEFAAELKKAIVELGTPVGNVDAFVGAFLEVARQSGPGSQA